MEWWSGGVMEEKKMLRGLCGCRGGGENFGAGG